MSRLTGRDTVLFDGDCGICTKSAQLAAKLDTQALLQIQAYFEFTEDELAPYGIDHDDCREYLCVITADGMVFSGAAAVNYIGLKLFPLSIAFGVFHIIPFALPFEALAYHLIAANRTAISSAVGLNACKVRRPSANG